MSAVTTQDAVYRTIVDTLLDGLSDLLPPGRVYYAASLFWDSNDDVSVQVTDIGPDEVNPTAGTHLIREEFQVSLLRRLMIDRPGKHGELISGASYGALAILQRSRTLLQGHELGSILVSPLHYIRSQKINTPDDEPGWARITDTWRCQYETEGLQL
jgi:hypothetical protein